MARIRTIKPEFFTSEDIVSMSPLARLFYVSLWCEADREGRMEWKPGTFKMRYLPADNCDIADLAKEMTERGLIVLYSVDGKTYAEIPTFAKHQVINNRESDSALPARPDASRTRAPRVKAEGKGRKGKEGKEPASEDAFAQFWDAWPKSERKQDKAKCAEKFKAQGFAEVLPAILADIAVKKTTDKWRGGFIEAPEVYLNNRRWEDGATAGHDISAVQHWTETSTGIIAKGKELGLGEPNPLEQFPVYRARVLKAANVVTQ